MFEAYKIKKLEKEANVNIDFFLEDLENQNTGDISNAKKYIGDIRLKYISLTEKLKHNKMGLLKIAIDWRDYTQLFLNQGDYTIARVNDEKGAMEAAEGIQVKLKQIEKRFNELLK